MTDDKEIQGTPSADPTIGSFMGPVAPNVQETRDAMEIMKKYPDTVALIQCAIVKKWGEETGGEFSKVLLYITPSMVEETDKAIARVFKDETTPKNEHVLHNWNKVKMRMGTIFFCRVFIAHIINRVQGIQETQDNFYNEFNKVYPYIEKEMQKAPEGYYMLRELDIYDGLTLPEVMTLWSTGEATGDQSQLLLNAIREAQRAEGQSQLPTVTYTKKAGVELTTDKLTTLFFGPNAPAPKGQIPGQMSFIPVKFEKDGAPEITLWYTFDFDNDVLNRLKLEKKIDDEDYFILSFIASYWRSGLRIVSISKLYRDMTGENPNTTQLTAITNRLMKIAATNIYINDRNVRQSWDIVDEQKTYKEILTPLAPIKVGAERFVTRGKVVESSIRIYDEPDIIRLGYEMGQYTTIPKNLLHVKKKGGRKLSRTPRFYRVLHYLIRRIVTIKDGRLSSKILYDTFYEETGETTIRGKQLARDCMYTILDHFKTCDKWITSYKEETTASTGKVGVRIFYTPKTPKIASKEK